jgi:hypothetical protein
LSGKKEGGRKGEEQRSSRTHEVKFQSARDDKGEEKRGRKGREGRGE